MKKKIGQFLDKINEHLENNPVNRSTQILQANRYEQIWNKILEKTPENIALKGYKVYSQHDEDGIIAEIFKNIPSEKTFIEIGIQDGTECNSLNLLLNGWKGVWIEGDDRQVAKISSQLGGVDHKQLRVSNTFIDADNIVSIYQSSISFLQVSDADFFSLDIDGNDLFIVDQLFKNNHFPKVFCVEYNGKFPPPMEVSIKYNANHVWDKTDYQGASLQSFVNLFQHNDYSLLCCNIVGANAFFIRNEFIRHFKVYPTAELYQPCRYYLSPMKNGHVPSLKFLRDLLQTN